MAMALTWMMTTKRATQPLTNVEHTAKMKALTRETQRKPESKTQKRPSQEPNDPQQRNGTG